MSDSGYLEKVLGNPWRIVEFFWLKLDLSVASQLWDQSLQKGPKGLSVFRELPAWTSKTVAHLSGCQSSPSSVELGSQAAPRILGSQGPEHPGTQGRSGAVSLKPPFLAFV